MRKLRTILQFKYLYYIILIISLIISFFRVNNHFPKEKPQNDYIGTVTHIYYSNNKYKIKIKNIDTIIGYYDGTLNINLGDKVIIKGSFYKPKNNSIPNTFNYKKYLNKNSIFYLAKIKSINVISKNTNIIFKIKDALFKRTDKLKNSGYIKAFILGDKNELDMYDSYQVNGVSHLFALSGMHISLLSSILYFFFKKFRQKDIMVIVFLILYILITNYSASLTRSLVFFILFKINSRYELNIDIKYILLITISLMLLFNPFFLFDYGFLYSIVVTYGLIICRKYFKKNYFYNLLLISLIAFLFSLPITLSLNYEINLLSVINNLILVPLISLIIYPLSLLTFVLPFIEPVFSLMIFILENINNFLNILAINVVIPKVNIIYFIFYYVLLLLFIQSNNIKYLIINFLLILSLKLLIFYNKGVYFLDVGQGDSILYVIPNKTTLIDTGGLRDNDISQNTVKFIKSLGYTKLNYLILTHGDYDHIGEAINLVQNFKVEKVIFNCGEFNDLEKDLIKVLDKKKIKYYSCIKELNIDKNKLYFLQTKEYDNENDNSNVIYTELNGYRFMFMGDASTTTEKEILSKYNLPDVDVLKVGHHGSRTSSGKDFINEINAKYSIISVGKNNRYGHPNKEVLDNLKGSKIYRTDQDGSIIFKIKNKKLIIETCSP